MEPQALARLIVRQKLKPLRSKIKELQFIDFIGIYKQLFTNSLEITKHLKGKVPDDWSDICGITVDALEKDKLFYEDATPFLLLKEIIEGFQINSAIKHIVIDEAQDYSPFQFEFLKRLFPAARMTVLGDFNQAIFAHADENTDFKMLTHLYGVEQTELINITRSYRSTKPIIELTRRLVPNGEGIVPFEREGKRPALTQLPDYDELHQAIASKVDEFKSEGYHSIAIICKSAEESASAYLSLASIKDLKLLKSNSLEYEQGVVVVPAYLSKGIEFDAVIIYNASEKVYAEESLRRTFYTACTRAMHDLHLYSVGKASPFLDKALLERALDA